MIIGIQGSKHFKEYKSLMQAMVFGMRKVADQETEVLVYSAGPANINAYVAEFCNVTERSLKARGIKIKFFNVPPSWIEKNFDSLDYMFFMGTKNEKRSKLIDLADKRGVDTHVFF